MYDYIEIDRIPDETKLLLLKNYKDYKDDKITLGQLADMLKLNKQNLRDFLMHINLDAGLVNQDGMIDALSKFRNITREESRDILCGRI